MQIKYTLTQSKNPLFIVLEGWTSSYLYEALALFVNHARYFMYKVSRIEFVNATAWNKKAKKTTRWLLKYINIRGELYELRVGVYEEEVHFMNTLNETLPFQLPCFDVCTRTGTFSSISSLAG